MWKKIPFDPFGAKSTPRTAKVRTGAFYQRAMPEVTVLTGQAAIDDHAQRKARQRKASQN
jgi:hypothetical protein